MTSAEARELMEKFYSQRCENCPETVLAHFTPDAAYAINGTPREGSIAMRMPDGAIAETAQHLVTTWDFQNIDLHSVVADGDQIFTRFTLTLRHVPTDTTTSTEIVDHITIRDGKMASMVQFVDTAHLGAVEAGTL